MLFEKINSNPRMNKLRMIRLMLIIQFRMMMSQLSMVISQFKKVISQFRMIRIQMSMKVDLMRKKQIQRSQTMKPNIRKFHQKEARSKTLSSLKL